jgi:hypothetical protein
LSIVAALQTKIAKILGASLLVMIGVAIVWFITQPQATDPWLITECRAQYSHVQNRADTLRIDGLVPEYAGRASAAMTCGEVRRAYLEVSHRE